MGGKKAKSRQQQGFHNSGVVFDANAFQKQTQLNLNFGQTPFTMLYYYHDGKEQKGPYSINELVSCGINLHTKVWKEGLTDWKDAGELEEMKALLSPVPPPFKTEKPVTPPPVIPPKKDNAPQKQVFEPAPKKTSYSGIIITFAVIGILATAAFFYSQYIQAKPGSGNESDYTAPAETYEEKKMSLAEQEAAYPVRFLSADGTYRETVFGKKFAVDIDVYSSATVATYKDIVIEFIFYSRTGTELERESYTFFEFVKPGNSIHIDTKISRPAAARKLGFEVRGASVAD